MLFPQPIQPSAFAILTSQHTIKNCNRAYLPAAAFLPTLKAFFSGIAALLLSVNHDFNRLITNSK